MDDDAEVHRVKRFKHQSYNDSLKQVHLPSALANVTPENEIGANESHFHESLDRWKQLNLAPSFLQFARQVDPLSSSMPLLLHHWRQIIDLWEQVVEKSDDEGLTPLFDLLQKISHDLRTTLLPAYPDLIDRLLKFLPRTIPAPVLTTLLATFSCLFKYLLIPSIDQKLLSETWIRLQKTIPKCHPEVQRAVAEVWGSVLRRLKTVAREKAVTLIAGSLSGVESCCAFVFVSACQSVSQTLHTSTVSVLTPLFNHYLRCEEDVEPVFVLIRRLLTSLIHHVNNAERFSVLGDLLTHQFCEECKAGDGERLRRAIELVTIPCSVRRGSRLTQKQLLTITTQFPSVPITPTTQPALLQLMTAVLIAGDMSLWINGGRKALEYAWEQYPRSPLAVQLSGALPQLGWGGWKQIGLPLLVRMSAKNLDDDVISLLTELCRENMIAMSEVDIVWKMKVENWVKARLSVWVDDHIEDLQTDELTELLTLSAFFPATCPLIAEIVNKMMDIDDSLQEDQEDQHKAGVVAGSCMLSLARHGMVHWSEAVDLAEWVVKGTKKWGTSEEVLSGLVSLSQIRPSKGVNSIDNSVELDSIYASLKPAIISHSRDLRLGALRLLTSPLVKVGTSAGTCDVLKRCLQGEEVTLNVQGVRERVLRIGRISQVVKEEDDVGSDACIRWLLAQLKVNLRPLWSPAAGALASLSHSLGDLVWDLMFNELVAVSQQDLKEEGSSTSRALDRMEDHQDDVYEEERTWRDPSAHKIRVMGAKWANIRAARMREIKMEMPSRRLDSRSYEHQLLSALSNCSHIVEKRNREFVPYFLSLAIQERGSTTTKLSRPRLGAWLSVFSKINNPKALHSTETLHALYTSLLSHPDRPTRSLALSCLATYKSPSLAHYENRLRLFLDETRWRDELVLLNMEDVDQHDRAELVNVVIRLLFGLMLEHKGRNRGADKRAAVLGALGGCTPKELQLLVELMLQSLRVDDQTDTNMEEYSVHELPGVVTEKQSIGFLMLLGDVLKHMGPKLLPYWHPLLGTTIDMVAAAQRRMSFVGQEEKAETDEVAEPEDEDEDDEKEEASQVVRSSKTTRQIRQLGLKRFADFIKCPVAFNFAPFMKASFTAFISVRLPTLDQENVQAPSALLELFSSWTHRTEHVRFLIDYDEHTLPQIYNCLITPAVRSETISRVFDIIDLLLSHSDEDDSIAQDVIKPHVSLLLTNLSILVERKKDAAAIASPLGQRQTSILSKIAKYCNDSSQASTLLDLLSPLLRKSSKLVPEKAKVDLLGTLTSLLPLVPELSDSSSSVYAKLYDMLSQLFLSVRLRPGRQALIATCKALASINPPLQPLVNLLDSLNAYATKRIDEADFNRRLEAFTSLNETLHSSLSVREWLPILYHMLFAIQDPAELSIRTNASYSMRRFIDLFSASSEGSDYDATFKRVLFPGLKKGLRTSNEQVRAEVLIVIAHAVANCTHIPSLQDMQPLLANGDEEASFFTNIYHIQIHRRSRALRRLADYCDEGRLRSGILQDIFIPLIANFIAANVDHHLVNEAIQTTGRVSKHLAWSAYFSLVQKYLQLSKDKRESERIYARTVVSILENFHFPMEDAIVVDDPDKQDDEEDHDDGLDESPASKDVNATTHDIKRIADAVNLRLLPSLLHHLEKYDASTEDSTRIPIAVGIAKIASHLPSGTRTSQIDRLLTVVSQIMRSKSQETRDLTRETLIRIAILLGPSYIPNILRELRLALLRGPQLHVLAFTVHGLLVQVTSSENAGKSLTLDDCVNDAAYVSAEVIFGESGKDVQAEDFKTKMREVRSSSSKGLDSFSILAKHITPAQISALLLPLKSIMQQTEATKTMQLVDEVLKRIAGGLNSNERLVPSELLVLCHTLISQNAKFLQQAPSRKKKATGDAIVQVKRTVQATSNHYANNSFRFVTFGLDLLHTALRRNRFDFHDASIISRLEPMVAVIGNTLYSASTPVLTLGMKTAAGLAKCPLKNLKTSIPVFIRQILDIIQAAGSTEPEHVQTALKSLATVLREGPPVDVKEKDLAFLLELLAPDLEETSRQSSVFTMLRAIVSRKFVVPEIYDMMAKVSEVMVTSQSSSVQEMCRGVLLQFLLDYPQGKGRLRNQMTFLAQNLSYVHESGRKSVMELLGAIINKFEPSLIREYADLLFVALVMVMANDDSAKCKEMAAHLTKSLLVKLDEDHLRIVMSHLHIWASQAAQPQLMWISSHTYGLVVDALQEASEPYLPTILGDLDEALSRSADELTSLEGNDEAMDIDLQWQIPYQALVAQSKILAAFHDLATEPDSLSWPSVVAHLLYPHAWVRTASCRLLGVLYSAIPVQAAQPELPDSSPFSQQGMHNIAQKLCLQLKSNYLDEALSLQIVKNLFYIGQCFAQVSSAQSQGSPDEPSDDPSEQKDNPLPWLFSKLSYQARSAHMARRNRISNSSTNWSEQLMAIIRFFAAMTSFLPTDQLEVFLVHLLTPIYRITEDDTIRDLKIEDLKILAIELQDLIQTKVGVTKFSAVYNQIRQGVASVRQERKVARVTQLTIDPAAAARRKLQKNTIKKESRKRKNRSIADNKGRYKRMRREDE